MFMKESVFSKGRKARDRRKEGKTGHRLLITLIGERGRTFHLKRGGRRVASEFS